MKKFEPFNHTADVGGTVYGKDIEELFINASEFLYFLAGAELKNDKEETLEIELFAPTQEDLLVKFLNELIYYMDTKNTGLRIKKLKIDIKEKGFSLSCEGLVKNIKISREIKAATYHSLNIKKEEDTFKTDIIFDI